MWKSSGNLLLKSFANGCLTRTACSGRSRLDRILLLSPTPDLTFFGNELSTVGDFSPRKDRSAVHASLMVDSWLRWVMSAELRLQCYEWKSRDSQVRRRAWALTWGTQSPMHRCKLCSQPPASRLSLTQLRNEWLIRPSYKYRWSTWQSPPRAFSRRTQTGKTIPFIIFQCYNSKRSTLLSKIQHKQSYFLDTHGVGRVSEHTGQVAFTIHLLILLNPAHAKAA